jgi:hypothetical protein
MEQIGKIENFKLHSLLVYLGVVASEIEREGVRSVTIASSTYYYYLNDRFTHNSIETMRDY